MPSLKDVKLQIAGVGKTKQITKAMGMVASSKLRGAQSRIERFRPYAEKFGQMLGDLAARTDGAAHPLLQGPRQAEDNGDSAVFFRSRPVRWLQCQPYYCRSASGESP